MASCVRETDNQFLGQKKLVPCTRGVVFISSLSFFLRAKLRHKSIFFNKNSGIVPRTQECTNIAFFVRLFTIASAVVFLHLDCTKKSFASLHREELSHRQKYFFVERCTSRPLQCCGNKKRIFLK